jgi:sulfur carrier protein
MLTIKLNGDTIEMEEAASALSALQQLNIDQNGIAVAVNNQIITKTKWAQTALKNNDEILIIKATQGG